MSTERNNIANFFNGLTIFITGGTGFLGSIFIEKILRSCPNVKQFYMLVRPKKGESESARLEKFLQKEIFDTLKKTQPKFSKKIKIVCGDVSLENFGLPPEDLQTLINETNCIINCAATVRYVETLRIAAHTNVRSTMVLVEISKKMKNLKSFLHISTAFTYCHLDRINEQFYEPPMSAEELMQVVDNSNDEELDRKTTEFLGDCCNTYVFTKAIAEDYLRKNSEGLPMVILRPGVVLTTHKEPIPAWIDNSYGPTGTIIAIMLGILRVFPMSSNVWSEIVPVDYVVNCGIALAASTERYRGQIPIFNYVSSPWTDLDWGAHYRLCNKNYRKIPSTKAIWTINFRMMDPGWYYNINSFILNKLRGHIIDSLLYITTGQKPFLAKMCYKLERAADAIKPILNLKTVYTNKNVMDLWKSLSSNDQQVFQFNMEDFHWDEYFYNYIKGLRIHILRDPMTTVENAQKKLKRLEFFDRIFNNTVQFSIVFLLCYYWFIFD